MRFTLIIVLGFLITGCSADRLLSKSIKKDPEVLEEYLKTVPATTTTKLDTVTEIWHGDSVLEKHFYNTEVKVVEVPQNLSRLERKLLKDQFKNSIDSMKLERKADKVRIEFLEALIDQIKADTEETEAETKKTEEETKALEKENWSPVRKWFDKNWWWLALIIGGGLFAESKLGIFRSLFKNG